MNLIKKHKIIIIALFVVLVIIFIVKRKSFTDMKLTHNFSKSEFDSKDGAEMPAHILVEIKKLAKNLQVLRDHVKLPIKINSGYRSPEHNAKIGGAKNSFHTKGQAGDIRIEGMTPTAVKLAIETLIQQGKMKNGGIGVYPTFVHYDTRNTPARW